MNATAHQAARTLLEALQQLRFDQPLAADDARYVDTALARGDFEQAKVIRSLEACLAGGEGHGHYYLYSGHIGCGKSTELRRLAAKLHAPGRFYVVMLDTLEDLDPHNLRYVDVLFALAAAMLKRLDDDGIDIAPTFLENLKRWFTERIEKHERTRELATEIKAGLEVTAKIPFLSKIFTALTNSLKINSTYKEELRTVVKDSYADFSRAFNQLIVAAEGELGRGGPAMRVLFVVDGTDRLSEEDGEAFFIHDIHQLQQIRSNFVYCAPIALVFRHRTYLLNIYTELLHLPMIKLSEKDDLDDRIPSPPGYEAMRKMIGLRVAPELFDDPATLDYLIRFSGGNPRHLLRLLNYAYTEAGDERFDRAAAEKAVKRYATDYRYQLAAEDYELLRRVDRSEDAALLPEGDRDRVHKLLYYGALLEYNNFWWRSHPVVRTLPAYRTALPSSPDALA